MSAAEVGTLEVGTSKGVVRGAAAGPGVIAFKGIPYAAPPFGPHRFAAPQPVAPWDGVRDATAFGPTAPHPGYAPPFDALLPDLQLPGEDCLTVNVWTPAAGDEAAALPVMVWIHGGAFVNGTGAIPAYDGTRFAADGVVLVTINYRLGVEGYGWFGDGGVENRGVHDQLAALRWVQEEIAAFGGDPGRVTVFGESAGAMSIGVLLVSAPAQGLFAQAVLQSGAGHHVLPPASAELVTAEVAKRLGVPATREAFAGVDPAALLVAQTEVARDAQLAPDPARWGEVARNAMAFEPVVDGDVVPGVPIEGPLPGDVALLVGSNRHEQRLWTVPSGVLDAADEGAAAFVCERYGLSLADARAAYGDELTPGELLSAVMGDWFFRVPAIRLADAAGPGRAWMYELAWGSPLFGKLGSCHAVDLGFVFDTLATAGSLAGEAPPQGLADDVHGAWVAFARDGDPGWPAYDPERRATMHFDHPASAVVDDPRPAERVVWAGVR